MKKILFLLITLLSFQHPSFAQDTHLVDSLETQLKHLNATKMELGNHSPTMNDTLTANILYALSKAYLSNNPDRAMEYANQTLVLSKQIGYKKCIGKAYNIMGRITVDKGDYLPALELFKKSLKIREDIGDKPDIAGSNNNIGVIYFNQGNYSEALKNQFVALKIFEEIGDKNGIAASHMNIGNNYWRQGNNTEALKNLFIALKLYEEIGDKNSIANAYINIGNIYTLQRNYSEALKNFFASLNIKKENGDKQGIAKCYNNIGMIYHNQGNYPEALKNTLAALKIREEIGDKQGIADSYNNIGNVYMKQKKNKEGFKYLNKALSLSKEIGSLENIKSNYEDLADLDSAQGNFKGALEHYKLFITIRDSLVNKENTKKIMQQQMQYDFDKIAVIQKAAEEKKDAIEQKELQKQKLVRNGFIGVTILFILLAGAIFMGLRKTSAEKKKSEKLLLNILPFAVATELKQTGQCQPKTYSMVTVMFTDFIDFTSVSEKVSAELLVGELNYCFSAFDDILQKHNIEKIKTVGDGYLCASGLPTLSYTHAFDMVMAALEMKNFIISRQKEKEGKGEIAFEIRIGIHTGSVVAGIVGTKKFSYDIWGDTVNIAARMESSSEAGQVNISGTTYELVKDKFKCTYRGKIEAKNKGETDMYFVETANPS